MEKVPDKKLPYGILISDFISFDFYNLEKDNELEIFLLEDLPKRVELFGFLAGYKDVEYKAVNPVDIEAAEHMGELHDALKENNYTGHELEMYLVRLLFCLFADDSGIFDEKKIFYRYINEKTNVDGSDLALHLGLIFDMLNKPIEDRQINRDEIFKKFPYVNGGLFEERLSTAAFNSNMRKTLLKCCNLDWSKIKPEIFGAMFQSIKDKEARRELGEHYTSETNILKVIQPLFLDNLWQEFGKIKVLSKTIRIQKLLEFHAKLQRLKFFDPACGCGNFLVVSYRELRLLEIEVLQEYLQDQKVLDIELMVRVNVDQFYGIEIEEFPAQIAKTSLWLMDHLMNNIASEKFGKYIVRIPLTATPNIIIGNALTIDWENVVPKSELSFIMGNPPFSGKRLMSKELKKELEYIFNGLKGCNSLDYVTCWFKKAANYIKNTNIEVAFVATNSICQGEQVFILWHDLLIVDKIIINFAHQTFKWSNEAKGKAAVHCVIIGFANTIRKTKELFIYNDIKELPVKKLVDNINAYLVDYNNIFISRRSNPISNVKSIIQGNYYSKSEGLIIEENDYNDFIEKEPNSKKYIKRFMGAEEFINNKMRYCLWLVDCKPEDIKKMPLVMKRIKRVKEDRLSSKDEAMKKLALTPTVFREKNNPDTCLVFPMVSSEKREYIPIGFIDKNIILSNRCYFIANANIYEFGILTSNMHMAWVKYICGRLEMRYIYSAFVYNSFSWPNPTAKQKEKIEVEAKNILIIREKYPESSLADLYDPLTMPVELLKAHQKLDKLVEKAYGKEFNTDDERIAHLFYLYRIMSEGKLFVKKPRKKK